MKLKILGQECPFCYTVSAQKEIADTFGGMEKIKDAFSGSAEEVRDNALKMAAAMMRGGEKRERLRCKMYGEKYDGPSALTAEELEAVVVTAEDMSAVMNAVLQAMKAGNEISVELMPSKKEKATG